MKMEFEVKAVCGMTNCNYIGYLTIFELQDNSSRLEIMKRAVDQLEKTLNNGHEKGLHDTCNLCGLPQSRCKNGECDEQ